MLKTRIIPCLDVADGRVVKGVNFVNLVDAGDPVEAAKAYDAAGADELCFLDITATHEDRGILFDVVSRTAEACFMPLTVGGGVRSIRSHIVGFFRGFEGGTEVRLANGQLWRQTDAADLPVHKTDPEVVIEKGFFGGYRLSVDGLNRSVRVKRIE